MRHFSENFDKKYNFELLECKRGDRVTVYLKTFHMVGLVLLFLKFGNIVKYQLSPPHNQDKMNMKYVRNTSRNRSNQKPHRTAVEGFLSFYALYFLFESISESTYFGKTFHYTSSMEFWPAAIRFFSEFIINLYLEWNSIQLSYMQWFLHIIGLNTYWDMLITIY